MKRDFSDREFEGLSKKKKKKYIAALLIHNSGAMPVQGPHRPLAFVMAGLPGAGKTEFLDKLEAMLRKKISIQFVRIDLDQIVTIFPKYTPQSYDKFRSHGNYTLAYCIDVARKGKYNIMIDGTFSGASGASVDNVGKLLEAGYRVEMFYMYDDAKTAWEYTQAREIETKRGISKEGFLDSCKNIQKIIKLAVLKFRDHKAYRLNVVVQKVLRDKDYLILSERDEVDMILKKDMI